jgi:purine nucleosidase/pyrimidine-specific ribonucleoside hydrolase
MVAIMLAAAGAEIDLLAITTVAGNGTLDKTTRNARATCELARIEGVPIAAGAPGPLLGALRTAPGVHGESALDGAALPSGDSVPLAAEHAVELVARLLREHPEPVTIVPVGPLTNVALLLRTHPDLIDRIAEIVLMGGSMGAGNVTPFAEFNIWVDPEAADVVLTSGVPVTLCGLDVTHQALATPDVLGRLSAIGSRLAATTVDLLGFFRDRYRERWGIDAPPVHDPVAVARVLDPTLVRCVDAHVAIELHGAQTRGATVCDRYGVLGRAPNAQVAVELDVARFWDRVIEGIARLG